MTTFPNPKDRISVAIVQHRGQANLLVSRVREENVRRVFNEINALTISQSHACSTRICARVYAGKKSVRL